jgi:hypothetical protein
MADLADVLLDTIRELHQARYERVAYKGWFRASLDKLHEQQLEIERQRKTIERLYEENRRLRGAEAA